ncbi:galactose-binding like protein [Metschnikowia bicuspidata var. bicuspidata NRRL YB-4993]|uniref:Galactose-binding like protein n=1 Tax=Metschnikowia bicuspidata var. bicuspidata NRRL YB-4993 TaxID=869754 RepID=A0A1A0H8A3_9ASCO|nr:galactose-binding like protein [Metschnikowia bicuspidata var. bicuspidata NRRL YB-4993]OBA20117.1 galactose-binding like protein [Metschnikowia bicuspidata var. bicuspidata NRRL YB-4993]
MNYYDTPHAQDILRAEVLHASSYSDIDRDALHDLNLNDNSNDVENSDQNHNSESMGSTSADHPTLEQTQRLSYAKGLEEIETLQLLDLSPLATWRLSSHKQGHGLQQLRDDSPDTFWQSDGSTEINVEHLSSPDTALLSRPHSILLQFSKKVSLERISIFTNYQLDESYTPLKIKIMAGGSNWDLMEVCLVDFEKPMGWSHIIFKGVRGDGLLKCFVVRMIILANHQDGKDSHIRAIRCFGKKSNVSSITALFAEPSFPIQKTPISTGFSNESGILLNNQELYDQMLYRAGLLNSPEAILFEGTEEENEAELTYDPATSQILSNVNEVLGFNLGFESLELKSVSSIR